MIVNATQVAASFQAQSANQDMQTSAGFMEAFIAASQSYSQTESPVTEKSSASAAKTAHQELATYLEDYVRKGPIRLMREAILKKMGLTEESLRALPPEKRAAVEKEIAEKIKEYLLTHKGNQPQTGAPQLSMNVQWSSGQPTGPAQIAAQAYESKR